LEQSIQLDPNFSDAYYMKAVALLKVPLVEHREEHISNHAVVGDQVPTCLDSTCPLISASEGENSDWDDLDLIEEEEEEEESPAYSSGGQRKLSLRTGIRVL
jgi:hypothetical protein